MLKPVSPVIPGEDVPEVVYAKDQPEYNPLPSIKLYDEMGSIISRWHMSWAERIVVLFTGDIYLTVATFNRPLQPLKMQVAKPELPTKAVEPMSHEQALKKQEKKEIDELNNTAW